MMGLDTLLCTMCDHPVTISSWTATPVRISQPEVSWPHCQASHQDCWHLDGARQGAVTLHRETPDAVGNKERVLYLGVFQVQTPGRCNCPHPHLSERHCCYVRSDPEAEKPRATWRGAAAADGSRVRTWADSPIPSTVCSAAPGHAAPCQCRCARGRADTPSTLRGPAQPRLKRPDDGWCRRAEAPSPGRASPAGARRRRSTWARPGVRWGDRSAGAAPGRASSRSSRRRRSAGRRRGPAAAGTAAWSPGTADAAGPRPGPAPPPAAAPAPPRAAPASRRRSRRRGSAEPRPPPRRPARPERRPAEGSGGCGKRLRAELHRLRIIVLRCGDGWGNETRFGSKPTATCRPLGCVTGVVRTAGTQCWKQSSGFWCVPAGLRSARAVLYDPNTPHNGA